MSLNQLRQVLSQYDRAHVIYREKMTHFVFLTQSGASQAQIEQAYFETVTSLESLLDACIAAGKVIRDGRAGL